MNIKTNFLKFFKGFKYAFRGILYCIKTQRNMRFHIGAAFYVVLFLLEFYRPTRAEMTVVFICIGGVMALECINTAVESLCDYACGGEKNKLIKAAKDSAAGGVLVMSVISVFVGLCVFWKTDIIFTEIPQYYTQHLIELSALVVSIIVWLVWVFTTNNKDKD